MNKTVIITMLFPGRQIRAEYKIGAMDVQKQLGS